MILVNIFLYMTKYMNNKVDKKLKKRVNDKRDGRKLIKEKRDDVSLERATNKIINDLSQHFRLMGIYDYEEGDLTEELVLKKEGSSNG